MIKFKQIRWRNFLSTGNVWNEIDLDSTSTTLIVGENGSGKSTFLDALCFGLFGKPFRNINKGQLINSVNQKQAEVSITFDVGKISYEIKRGIKPNVFEIFKNGHLLNQDASVRDYQQLLEEQVLGFTYNSFCQIVILGSASFTPFMELPIGGRRMIVEDLLDIRIFSTMNRVLKDKHNALQSDLMNIEGELELQKHKTMVQKSYIETLKQDTKSRIQDNKNAIEEAKKKIELFQLEYASVKDEQNLFVERNKNHTVLYSQRNILENGIKQHKQEIVNIEKEKSFYSDNNECPSCEQEITDSHRAKQIDLIETDINNKKFEIEKLETEIVKLDEQLSDVASNNEELSKLTDSLMSINSSIQASQQFIEKLLQDNQQIQSNTADIDEERRKLQESAQEVVDLMTKRSEMNEERQYFNVAVFLLKDTGIKTKIIKQYLPLINKLVNKYLQAMDLFISFELDEQFNEIIKSRYRDEFTYASFSEGEKQRINLALLFAWRAVATLRNTTNTNLIVFDEVLDGSLDSTAVEYFLNLMREIAQKHNIFVITHKSDLFVDRFEKIIKVKKVSGYSVLETIEK